MSMDEISKKSKMAASHNSKASKNIITALDKVSKMKEKGQYDAVA